jgi:FkbM family methyltransferase
MRIGNLIAPLVYALPQGTALPIVTGPLRGRKWIVSSQTANFWYGTFEREKARKFQSRIEPGSIVYDVGANVGYYTLLAAPRAATVLSFEPVPSIADLLQRHLDLNHITNCVLIRKAVSKSAGEVRFSPTNARNNGSGHFSSDGPLCVQTISLDEFCRDNPPPSVIKMDIEGAETMALQGAMNTLSTHHPVIFLATHGDCAPDCLALLRSLNYKVEMLAEDEILATK